MEHQSPYEMSLRLACFRRQWRRPVLEVMADAKVAAMHGGGFAGAFRGWSRRARQRSAPQCSFVT